MNWPKLPNRKSFLDKGYTAIQMREYAEKCVKIALDKKEQKDDGFLGYHMGRPIYTTPKGKSDEY